MTALYPVDTGSPDPNESTAILPPASNGGAPPPRPPSRRRRTILLIVLGVLVVAIPFAVWAVVARPYGSGTSPLPTATAGPTAAPTGPAQSPSTSAVPLGAGTWHKLPAAPVPPGYYTGVWTGTELFIYEPATNDTDTPVGSINAAYNPVTNSWRRVPSSSLPFRVIEGGYRAIWTGTEVLTFGMMDAAYNPSTNRWRPVAAGPYGPSVTVWTGKQVLSWGGGCCGGATASGSAYDPVRNTWTPMPAAPLSARYASGTWTGKELIIVGGQVEDTVFTDAAAYNPTSQTWRRLPSLPSPVVDFSITWTGTEVYVIGGALHTSGGIHSVATAMAYNPATDTWRRLADMPLPRSRHAAVWTGHQLIVWGGQRWPALTGDLPSVPPYGLAYDPATNHWAKLPVSPLRGRTNAIFAWTGTDMLVWGGIGVNPELSYLDGAAFRPATG